jgi:hypothetical protein
MAEAQAGHYFWFQLGTEIAKDRCHSDRRRRSLGSNQPCGAVFRFTLPVEQTPSGSSLEGSRREPLPTRRGCEVGKTFRMFNQLILTCVGLLADGNG